MLLFVTQLCIAQAKKNPIIGNAVKIGNLLVAQNDFPVELSYEDAIKFCDSLGKGWRLPTKFELNLIYINKNKIGGLNGDFYWSSSPRGNHEIWYQRFYDGFQGGYYGYPYRINVRAVMSK